MNAHQGPSNSYSITPNALPRDIRVRGSKSVKPHYRNLSMENRASTTHTQPSNTEKHYTHPENNADTNAHHTPNTKDYSSPNSYRKGTQINKPFALSHTNDSKICTNNTEKPNKLDQTRGNHTISQSIYTPEEPAKNITQKQSTKHKQIIPHHKTPIPSVSGFLYASQSFRGSRHFYCNFYPSQTTGGPPPSQLANVGTPFPIHQRCFQLTPTASPPPPLRSKNITQLFKNTW